MKGGGHRKHENNGFEGMPAKYNARGDDFRTALQETWQRLRKSTTERQFKRSRRVDKVV